MIKKAGVVGDVHCEDARLEATLAFFAKQNVDQVLAVGDLADGTGDLARCCRLLERAGALVVTGNHDRWLLDGTFRDVQAATAPDAVGEETKEFLRRLPTSRVVETAAGALLLCHGLGDDDMAQLKPDDYGYALDSNGPLQHILRAREVNVVVGGHTHRRMVRRLAGIAFINAGTIHRAFDPGFPILDLEERVAQFYDLLDEEEIVPAERSDF